MVYKTFHPFLYSGFFLSFCLTPESKALSTTSESSCAQETLSLPSWDLRDFYKEGISDPTIEKDLQQLEEKTQAFSKLYEGNVPILSAPDLLKAIQTYEELVEKASQIQIYAHLLYAVESTNPQISHFYQYIMEKITQISSGICFFTLEMTQREDLLQMPDIQKYRPWIRVLLDSKPHQLSTPLEQLMMEKSLTGAQAWVRLYDETLASLRFKIDAEENLTLSDVLNKFGQKDPSLREKAARSLSQGLRQQLPLFAYIMNTLAKDKEISDRWYKFPHSLSQRNLSNQIEDDVVQALVQTVQKNYQKLTHRYYALKAHMLGRETLNYWDRNAPFPQEKDFSFSWEEATQQVLKAYEDFSPSLAQVGRQFIDHSWIDVGPKAGKQSGAFACSVPGLHPYLLLNYYGKRSDVMTLAHEMGHGIHQIFSQPHGALMSDCPLTLAETASVFGEMLTFQAFLKQTSNPEDRKYLLANKIESMLNTVVRQVAFHFFESQIHEARQKGELTIDQINEIWVKTQRETLGPSVTLDGDYAVFWAYISHFIHAPFYVYSYAFGDCLVNSLFALYQKESPEGKKIFAQKYETLLKAGGTLRHKELLAPFGLDATDPEFWAQGLSLITQMMDELESLVRASPA